MGNSPYLPIHIECVFRIQQLSEFASAQTEFSGLKRFEMYLRQRDCSWNTVSTYMKVIRSAYNRAVDLRYVRYIPRLFEHVYTGTKADKKRALEASDIGALVCETEMDLSKRIPSSRLQKAKMLFVFMFMMRGLPFVDLAFCVRKTCKVTYYPIVEENWSHLAGTSVP